MTTRCVVNADTLHTLLSLAISKHRSRAISGLSEGRRIHVPSFVEEIKPIFFFALQLDSLRLMKYNDTVNIVDNYRPVQRLNGRQVKARFTMITTAPPVTTTAPPVTTVAPSVTTVASSVTTVASSVTTVAPSVTTVAPPVTTVAPSVTTVNSSVTTTTPSGTTDGVALKISNVVLLLVLLLGAAFFH